MRRSSTCLLLTAAALFLPLSTRATEITGEVRESRTGRPLPCRLYVESPAGDWFFATSASPEGSAVRYDRKSGFNPRALERHTTLSPHPFKVEVPPGIYTFTVERGKEYRALTRKVEVGDAPLSIQLELERWIDMAALGWYSGDTHNHRDPAELPNVQLAEDLNVAFPMVYWTTRADVSPLRSPQNIKGSFPAGAVTIDATHLYHPLNTEYEIFNTAGKQHTLGAVLVLGHKTVFDLPALPLGKVASRARAEGALLDLEKHNWPWSMAIVPLLKVDLYELANNHHWRVEFSVTNWADPAPAWMGLRGSGSATERDWTLYGFLNYYTLLDCGFRLRPTAGTANGVHPVPLGFSRVYVKLEAPLTHERWIAGLDAGKSFVTTGPMLLCEASGTNGGNGVSGRKVLLRGRALGENPIRTVEVILNGQVWKSLSIEPRRDERGAFVSQLEEEIPLEGSSWIAVRAWEEREGGRFRFAHTAPWHFDIPGKPLRPRPEEKEFLVGRARSEIERSAALLPAEALEEFRAALRQLEEL